jgi:hypothetical protein
MKWRTCASEAYCCSWGVPDLEWDLHNQLQLGKVDLIDIQECHSGLDCRSQLCQNFNHWPNHRPGHTQQQKVQVRHEYSRCVSISDAMEYRSEVCPNSYDIPAQAAALPRNSEPMSHILTPELNHCVNCVDCGMGLAIMQWQSWRYVPRRLQCAWPSSIRQQ